MAETPRPPLRHFKSGNHETRREEFRNRIFKFRIKIPAFVDSRLKELGCA
jgi:hypothetical protein